VRRAPLVAALLGVVLLVTGLIVRADGAAASAAQQAGLRRVAAQDSAAFVSYLERARGLDLLLAQHPALSTAPAVDVELASNALRYLEMLYPAAISEACLIDSAGHELARVVGARVAPPADLSTDETANAFFALTLGRLEGEVFQAPPYVSPDTGEWVISNSTWLRRSDGSRVIVHFELTLASFQPYLHRAAGQHGAVVDARTGEVLLSSDHPLPAVSAGFPVTDWSRRLVAAGGGDAGRLRIDGRAAAAQRIDRAEGGASDWYAVEWSTGRASLVGASAGSVGAVLGLLLLALALAGFRRDQRLLGAAARLDHLTGLGNRQALEEALDEAVDRADPYGQERIAVLMLDLDGFKQVNDSLGHDRGDEVLKEIARRLHANVFEYDTAARVGGDEFAIVLRRLKAADDVAVVAHRLREALVRPIEIDGVPRYIGASIGAALYPDHGRCGLDLLRGADAAMYLAKRGREGVRVYDSGTTAGARNLDEAARLLRAVEQEQITLVFQAQHSTATGAVVAYEALARWQPEDGPCVPPDEFVLLAEQTGLIRALTLLTFRRALTQAAAWWAAGQRLPVGVNLSGQVLCDRTLAEEILALLTAHDLPGRALVVEVTETAVISDRSAAVRFLDTLRSAGVGVELDDFGTGYASLAALRSLPLDGIKIDRSIISTCTAGTAKLLTATVELAHELGLYVVAEGVETGEVLQASRDAGCDRSQGYHLGRPVPADLLPVLGGLAAVDGG